MSADELYAELYDYDTLEAAYEAVSLYLEDPPEDGEPWLINLQNHLIWRSYETGESPDFDTVVLCAADIIRKRHGLRALSVPGRTGEIIRELMPETERW